MKLNNNDNKIFSVSEFIKILNIGLKSSRVRFEKQKLEEKVP